MSVLLRRKTCRGRTAVGRSLWGLRSLELRPLCWVKCGFRIDFGFKNDAYGFSLV